MNYYPNYRTEENKLALLPLSVSVTMGAHISLFCSIECPQEAATTRNYSVALIKWTNNNIGLNKNGLLTILRLFDFKCFIVFLIILCAILYMQFYFKLLCQNH